MPGPVGGVGGFFGQNPCAGDVGEIGDLRRIEGDGAEALFKLTEDGVHHCGVEGVGGDEAARGDGLTGEALFQRGDGGRRA